MAEYRYECLGCQEEPCKLVSAVKDEIAAKAMGLTMKCVLGEDLGEAEWVFMGPVVEEEDSQVVDMRHTPGKDPLDNTEVSEDTVIRAANVAYMRGQYKRYTGMYVIPREKMCCCPHCGAGAEDCSTLTSTGTAQVISCHLCKNNFVRGYQ